MENEEKVDRKKEIPIIQSLHINRGPILFGSEYPRKTKEYICSNCGKIIAADVLWKTEDNVNKPFCGNCRKPVILSPTE